MESANQKIEQAYENMGRPSAVEATIRNMFVSKSDQVRLVLTLKAPDDANVHTVELGTSEFYATGLLESMAESTLRQLFGNNGLALKKVYMPREKKTESENQTDEHIPDTVEIAAA